MKKIKIISIIIMCTLIIGLLVNSVWAYLSSEVKAKGSIKFKFNNVHIKVTVNNVSETKRNIVVTNDGTAPCYIRVRLFSYGEIDEFYEIFEGNGWFDGQDGYVYCSKVIEPGETQNDGVTITIESNCKNNYDIPIIVEAAEVFYDSQGEEHPNMSGYEGWSRRWSIE